VREQLQILLYDNESQLRRLELVKEELQQVKKDKAKLILILQELTLRNEEIQAVFNG